VDPELLPLSMFLRAMGSAVKVSTHSLRRR
jgi:hypothetical protein